MMGQAQMKPEISIVLAPSPTAPPIDGLLDRIEAQTFASKNIECIVVPATPLRETDEERIRASRLSIEVLAPRPGMSPCDRLDRGVSRARGAIAIFIDESLRPEVTWLADYKKAFEETDADVISGGDFDDELRAGLRALCELRQHPVACAYAFTISDVAVRKAMLDRTSGFNPCMQTFGDVELGIRLWEMGARFALAKRASTFHGERRRALGSSPSHDDVATLFWRHPYSWILLMAVWMKDRETGGDLASRRLVELHAARDDLDPLAEYLRAFGRDAARLETWMTQDRLALHVSAFRGVPVAEIRAYLEDARARGVLCRREGAEIAFDASLAHNWIQDCHVMFQQNHLEECLVDERRRTPFMRSGDPTEQIELRCHARYEVTVDANALGQRSGLLHIPLPISHSLQTDLELVDCRPPALWNHVNRDKGMILDIPLTFGSAERLSFSYELTCRVREASSKNAMPVEDLPSRDRARLTSHAFPPAQVPRAKELLEDLGVDATADPVGAARAIYRWLQGNVVFVLRPVSFPFYRVLDAGYGDCIAQMLLFVSLCQLAGIPARYQCGTRFHDFDPMREHNHLNASLVGSSPLSHTWAEFYAADRGWFSVELQGYGKRRINAANVEGPTMRDAIRDAIGFFEDDRFGQLAPCRIYASPSVIRRPTHAIFTGTTAGAADKLSEQKTSHSLTCDFWRVSK
ncbi:MAG: transglutaminase domain-containing protein [Polyangiaceae bacterium]